MQNAPAKSGDNTTNQAKSYKTLLGYFLISIAVYFLMEILCHKGILPAVSYLISSPLTFLYNCMIVFLPITFAFLLRRRTFAVVIIWSVWMISAIANLIISSNRVTPFTYLDFSLLISQFSNIIYLPIIAVIFMTIGIIALVLGIILLYKKIPKIPVENKISYKKVLLCIGGYLAAFLIATVFTVKTGVVQTVFPNITLAYQANGFPYSFFANALNRGIHRPSGYNGDSVKALLTNQEKSTPTETPNIIMLQLESFFDPKYVKDWQLSDNPIPTFTELKDNYSSGFLTVPGFGMGTVNTEFEVMTGMSVNFFGTGEYPYKTVLKNSTVESMPYNLRKLDYATHAIHNNDATFYNRQLRFPNLGFETFTPIEFMNITEMTPNGWAQDKFLTDEILKSLDSSEKRDYVYAISVQGHGKYPTEVIDPNQKIILSCSESDEKRCGYEYYVNQLSEMDTFVRELIGKLSQRDEKTMLVLYGDHLPTFDITNSGLDTMNIYQTEYVIWDNFGLQQEDKDLFAYQLSANISQKIGMDSGITTYFHQNFEDDKDYLQKLKLLQYDMIYGKKYAYNSSQYNGTAPEPVFTRYDVEDIKVSSVETAEKGVFVNGSNFTEYSKVLVNGELQETIFISPEKLLANDIRIKESDNVQVAQVQKDNLNESLWDTEFGNATE